jgi:hypothetical protein
VHEPVDEHRPPGYAPIPGPDAPGTRRSPSRHAVFRMP